MRQKRQALRRRLDRLHADLQPSLATIELTDGARLQIRERCGIEILCEVIAAAREGREPNHPELDTVRRMERQVTGSGSMLRLAQVMDQSVQGMKADEPVRTAE